jgi:hypothetical protein
MKTAEKFIQNFLTKNHIGNVGSNTEMLMIEFAKLHVKAALEAADREVPLHCSEGVLNCYPESNIK